MGNPDWFARWTDETRRRIKEREEVARRIESEIGQPAFLQHSFIAGLKHSMRIMEWAVSQDSDSPPKS